MMSARKSASSREKKSGNLSLRLVSSGTKIWNQVMMFLVIGILPLAFPSLIQIEHRETVLVIVSLALLTSIIFEIWRSLLDRYQKDSKIVLNVQLLTSVVLLTFFLHFFGRINGPFFVLYLLTVMESFLNRNIFLSNIILGSMLFTTIAEFAWLTRLGEINFGFVPIIELMIRLISLVFMSAYGYVLAQKIDSEESAKNKVQETAIRLKNLSSDLKLANAKLKDLSALKDEFVSVASHELRAPMTTIKGYLSMVLEGDTGKVGGQTREFLKNAYEGNERMIRLVNNMLNISRIESGRLVINPAEVQLEEIITAVVADFQIEAEEKNLRLVFKKPSRPLPKVRVDPDRIREVIGNLVGNALKFTQKGSVTVTTRLEKGQIVTEVADTGSGISDKNQKKLFRKFSQVGDQSEVDQKGSGLGLYICKNLIKDFGGQIWLESELGKGTSFFFSLPVVKS